MSLPVCLLTAALLTQQAQDFTPPPSKTPDAALLKTIKAKTDKLGQALATLRRQGVRDPLLADVEIYHKAAVYLVRHEEYFTADSGPWTVDVLDRGLLRARQLSEGEGPWLRQIGVVVPRAYRSVLDGSVQPYAVTLPPEYGKDPMRKWRLDVVLHGRDASLTEVKFLRQRAGDKPAAANLDRVVLEIYGRGNNAYRWAGEMDVKEAVQNFVATETLLGRSQLLDQQRFVLRGFSMGGAGTWHLGLHHPDSWCALQPGAGFTTTHGYIKGLPNPLPPYQQACLHIYDAVDYAENVFNVPVVAYGGDKDPQLKAAQEIEQRLKGKDYPLTVLVAPGLEHRFPPEWQQKAETALASHLARGREEFPKQVRFVTYTLKYPRCDWVEILGLQRHYEYTLVDAERTDNGFNVKTRNVEALALRIPVGMGTTVHVQIDGQKLEARTSILRNGTQLAYLSKKDGRWDSVLPQRLQVERLRLPRKVHNLQGPIDDAFMAPFLCVRGTGKPWNEAVEKAAEDRLERFRQEWNKFFRGELPIKNDVEVSDDDIATRHLILFGDPGSNSLMAQVLPALPLKWTPEKVSFGVATFEPKDHLPTLIHPSPLQPDRYIVLNSGHTFNAAEFKGTNAQLYPRLGDYAILKLTPTAKDPLAVEIATAGLFNDLWQVEK